MVISPTRGKALVKIYKLTHPNIIIPQHFLKSELSVAEVVSSAEHQIGSKVLIATTAGLSIDTGKERVRLINESDIIALLVNRRWL